MFFPILMSTFSSSWVCTHAISFTASAVRDPLYHSIHLPFHRPLHVTVMIFELSWTLSSFVFFYSFLAHLYFHLFVLIDMHHTASSPAPATILVPALAPTPLCMGGKARMSQLITSWESWRAGEWKWSSDRRGRVTALHPASSEPVVRTLHNTT